MKQFALLCLALTLSCCTSNSNRSRSIVVLEPDQGDYVRFFHPNANELGSGGELQIYIDPVKHPDAGASFAKFTLGIGGELPVHRHDRTEEIAYILSGIGVAISLDDNGNTLETPLSEGYVWYNPTSAWHAVRNTGSDPLVMIFATVPNEKNGLLSFFRRIGVEPGMAPAVISEEEFNRLASEHDLILHGGD